MDTGNWASDIVNTCEQNTLKSVHILSYIFLVSAANEAPINRPTVLFNSVAVVVMVLKSALFLLLESCVKISESVNVKVHHLKHFSCQVYVQIYTEC